MEHFFAPMLKVSYSIETFKSQLDMHLKKTCRFYGGRWGWNYTALLKNWQRHNQLKDLYCTVGFDIIQSIRVYEGTLF